MEESSEVWKGYVITFTGRFYSVRNATRYLPGMFTTRTKAREFIDRYIIDCEKKEYTKALNKIRKEPDLKKRSRMYKELCQANQ